MNKVKFKHKYLENRTAFVRFAKKLARNKYDAEDLVQESLLKAFKAKNNFKLGSSFKSWVFTIIKNTFITKYNRRRKQKLITKPVEEIPTRFAVSKIKNRGLSNLRIDEIKSNIFEFSYKVRLPFLMYLEGYQYKEIADTLDIPIGTVKSRINYCRSKLQQKIVQQELLAA